MNNFGDLLKQAFRFGIIGFLNTLLTFLVIFILKEFLGTSLYIANLAGYTAGLINSFFWNRSWTFKDGKGDVRRQLVFFVGIWAFCFLIETGILYLLVDIIGFFEYASVFIGMVVYTGLSFFLNRFITFRSESSERRL